MKRRLLTAALMIHISACLVALFSMGVEVPRGSQWIDATAPDEAEAPVRLEREDIKDLQKDIRDIRDIKNVPPVEPPSTVVSSAFFADLLKS